MAEKTNNEIRDLLGAARSQFEYLRDLGLDEVTLPATDSLAPCPLGAVDLSGAAPCQRETLEDIERDLRECTRCALCKSRSRIVFGVGNPTARLVFVGEAPGREEDQKGEPFVGEAGRLLDRILFAMGMIREEVYICNVLKCRPPQNRDPEPDEVSSCEPFLIRQLAAIQPQVIVALGRFAVQSLLKTKIPISRLRGEWHEYQGIPLMPTYHPAYLLRNPEGKRDVWDDMKAVRKRLADLARTD